MLHPNNPRAAPPFDRGIELLEYWPGVVGREKVPYCKESDVAEGSVDSPGKGRQGSQQKHQAHQGREAEGQLLPAETDQQIKENSQNKKTGQKPQRNIKAEIIVLPGKQTVNSGGEIQPCIPKMPLHQQPVPQCKGAKTKIGNEDCLNSAFQVNPKGLFTIGPACREEK
ncbi:hypothetical protein JCM17207_05080 [Faecalibacterium gallinarum]|uniref:Uncharacterized protein n=1 Tax=Faecalibacterium gallinarum TaxID=2903556 RepID=A0AA37MYI9_9FIRM|nr:hypothetical protein JCM17207_05080 [Faecalibacterium gallinarum]